MREPGFWGELSAFFCSTPDRDSGTSPPTTSNADRGSSTNTMSGADSDSLHGRKIPPRECEGYPPVLFPAFLQEREQVDLYIPKSSSSSGSNGDRKELACSLIRRIHTDDDKDATIRTVKGLDFSFDIDSSKPIIVLCHGYMSWRNQMLLVFLAAHLSRSLECHALRFDFTGNGHSSGQFQYSNYDGELKDLRDVVRFVQIQMGCSVLCLIGHSKGAQSVLRFAWEQDDQNESLDPIPAFVNLAGRYSVPNSFDVRSRLTRAQFETLLRNGRITLGERAGRQLELTEEDVVERTTLDSSLVRNITGAVLTIHGGSDVQVDVSNAHTFARVVPRHELYIIESADHNFNGLRHMDELTSTIAEFVRRQYRCFAEGGCGRHEAVTKNFSIVSGRTKRL